MTSTLLPPVAPPPVPDPESLERAPEVPPELRAYRRRYLRRMILWSLVPVLVVVVVALKLLSMPLFAGLSQGAYERRNFDQTIAASDALAPANVLEPWVRYFDRGTGLARLGVVVEARTEFESALSRVPASNVRATCLVRTDLALVVELQGDAALLDGQPSKASGFYTHALQLIDQSPDGCFDDPDSSDAPPTKKPLEDEKSRLEQKQQQAQGGSDGDQGQGDGGSDSQGGGGSQGDPSQGDGQGQGQGGSQGDSGDGGGSSGSGSDDPLDQLQQQNDDAQQEQQQNNDRNRQFDQTPKDYTGKPW